MKLVEDLDDRIAQTVIFEPPIPQNLPPTNHEIQTAEFDGNMNSAGFRIGHHAVFVVSDLTAAENVSLARFAAPAIRSHFERIGA